MLDSSAGSNVKIRDAINSEQYPEILQRTALDLSQSVAPLLGKPGRLRLLETSANVSFLFVCSELQPLNQTAPLTAEHQKQAELAKAQAAALTGSIALFCGEHPSFLSMIA